MLEHNLRSLIEIILYNNKEMSMVVVADKNKVRVFLDNLHDVCNAI